MTTEKQRDAILLKLQHHGALSDFVDSLPSALNVTQFVLYFNDTEYQARSVGIQHLLSKVSMLCNELRDLIYKDAIEISRCATTDK